MTETMPTPDSRATAEQYVAETITGAETDPAAFDVERIADALYIVNRSWDLTRIDTELFWEAVEMCPRA